MNEYHPLKVGDHCQLQPFSQLQSRPGQPETQHSRSLLERAVTSGLIPWLLNIQYRMPERLSSLVSDLFYKGRLLTADSLRYRHSIPVSPCRWKAVTGGEVTHEKKGYSNLLEVAEVVNQIALALEAGNSLVYVTTPYNKQKKAILDALALRDQMTEALEDGRLQVLTIDACQGSEADCVILSLVRNSGVNAFLEDRRRICVALSRSKRECVIVGDAENFRRNGSEMWRRIVSHFNIT